MTKFELASDIVELVVLTADEVFLRTLRGAVGGSRRLWHVLSGDKVGDLLIAGQVGILVSDVHALHGSAEVFVTQLKRQFPDLIIVMAGNREAEASLAPLISSGMVYRFIHKPLSPARAKAFADAAVRRHAEQRARATAPAAAGERRDRRGVMLGLAAAGAAVMVATLWLLADPAPDPPDGAPSVAVPGTGHAERERLLRQAENALRAGRLEEASAALDAARGTEEGVDTDRLNSLRDRLNEAQRASVATNGSSPRR